jgi:hypothetical protein
MNPPAPGQLPSDNPKVAEQLWTFRPKGPKGRIQPAAPFFWSIWKFSKNKSVARSLLTYLSQRPAWSGSSPAAAVRHPPFSGLRDFKIWAEAGPPKVPCTTIHQGR